MVGAAEYTLIRFALSSVLTKEHQKLTAIPEEKKTKENNKHNYRTRGAVKMEFRKYQFGDTEFVVPSRYIELSERGMGAQGAVW